MKMNNKIKKHDNKKQGISLIVLIITIAVVIILAAAVILSMNNNRPIESAKTATEKNDIATLKESASVLSAQWEVDKLLDETIGTRTDYVQSGLTKQRFEQGMISKVVVDEKTGKITVSDTEQDDANNPTIPNGFEHVEGTEVATGFVIRNSRDGNEFVWVPVEDIAEFVRENGYGYDGRIQEDVGPSGSISEPLNYFGSIASLSETEEYNAMKASVEKYKGFYIGRYETSNNGSGKAQSLPNKSPWIDITWGNSMTDLSGGAVEKARAVYPVSNATKEKDAVSTLMYGVQWDATVRFLKINYPGIEKDSTRYGNYGTYNSSGNLVSGSKINTGSNDRYKLNEIYDLAGNCWEWTMEATASVGRVLRGGDYAYSGAYNPVSYRLCNDRLTYSYGESSFRLALYIK